MWNLKQNPGEPTVLNKLKQQEDEILIKDKQITALQDT